MLFRSRSQGLLLIVNNPGFSIAASPTSLSLSSGATTGNSATLTYTSLGGFSGTINQTCAVTFNGIGTANDIPTCSYSAQSTVLPAGGTVTGTITVFSTAPGGSGGSGMGMMRGPEQRFVGGGGTALAGAAFGALFFVSLASGRRRRLNLWQMLTVVFMIGVACASISGCGGGSGSSSSAPAPGTSAGSYTISLTGSSGTTVATPAASISLSIH